MKKIILGLLIAITFTLSSCTADEKETVVVLTSSGYEPYEMVDTNGNLTGFDIELMEALAAEIGIEIEWKDVDFGGIVASLQSGQEQIAIAGLSPTEERKEMVDFSNIYYNSEAGLTNFLVFDSASSVTGLDDLSGLVVGAQMGTVQAGLLTSISEEYGFTVDLRSDNTQIVQEIIAGRIDVLVVEGIIADSLLESNTSLAKVGFESPLDDVSGNAIAFAKDSEYLELFNAALVTLEENGTLAALIEKWMN
jgi:polar amino acid transport system substrate-binding protein